VRVCDGVRAADIDEVRTVLTGDGATLDLIAPADGAVAGHDGGQVSVDHALPARRSVLYDAVFVPGGSDIAALAGDGAAVLFVAEAYKHGKAIAATGHGVELLEKAQVPIDGPGVVATAAEPESGFAESFRVDVARHRHYTRHVAAIPA
jgi:catalase